MSEMSTKNAVDDQAQNRNTATSSAMPDATDAERLRDVFLVDNRELELLNVRFDLFNVLIANREPIRPPTVEPKDTPNGSAN